MDFIIILLAAVTFFATLIGGLLVIKLKKMLPYFFAFAAGSLIAVVFLDLIPETLEISEAISFPFKYLMIIVVASFFVYNLIEKFFATHELGHDEHGHIMGPIGAGSLVIHSLLDGVAIGVAYHINPAIGLIVALAVISHDFTDGMNTVTLMLKNKHTEKRALLFLLLDAAAPVVGVLITFAIFIPEAVLAVLLAIFIGEFLYIGASTLLPEIHKDSSKKSLFVMFIGIVVIAVLTSLV